MVEVYATLYSKTRKQPSKLYSNQSDISHSPYSRVLVSVTFSSWSRLV